MLCEAQGGGKRIIIEIRTICSQRALHEIEENIYHVHRL